MLIYISQIIDCRIGSDATVICQIYCIGSWRSCTKLLL